MNKHTPGPWEVAELVPDGTIIKRSGTYQLWTRDYDVAADVPGGGPFRKLEDAVLAAAAPELLEALKACDAALRHHPAGDNRSDEGIAKTSAAIAKATERPDA